MGPRKEGEAAENSGQGAASAVRSLYPAMTLCVSSAAANDEEEPAWIELDLRGRDAPISVWWDQPPGGDL